MSRLHSCVWNYQRFPVEGVSDQVADALPIVSLRQFVFPCNAILYPYAEVPITIDDLLELKQRQRQHWSALAREARSDVRFNDADKLTIGSFAGLAQRRRSGCPT